ncbi:MAG: HAD family hydrolase [Candidatus Nanoarchaeia archaeon]
MAAKHKSVGFDEIICFDFDGTLANSQQAHAVSFNLAFEKNNLPKLPEEKIIMELGPPAEAIVRKLFPGISEAKLQQVVADKQKFFVEQTAKLVKPIEGVAKALEELSKDFKLAIYSHATRAEISAAVQAAGLKKKWFAAILGTEDIHLKPDPDIIDTIEEKAKGKVIWLVGDTIYDIRTGKNANVRTIAVLTGVHDLNTLAKENPSMILQSIALLPEYFKGEL